MPDLSGRVPSGENSLRCTGDESCPKPWHWQEGVHTAGFVTGRVPTLREAQRQVSKAECAATGHSWDVFGRPDGIPRRIVCDRCGVTYAVTAPASTPSPGGQP